MPSFCGGLGAPALSCAASTAASTALASVTAVAASVRHGRPWRRRCGRATATSTGAGVGIARRRQAERRTGARRRDGAGGGAAPALRRPCWAVPLLSASRIGWPASAAAGVTPISAATWSDGRLPARRAASIGGCEHRLARPERPARRWCELRSSHPPRHRQSEVLADACVGTLGASDRVEDGDGLRRLAGERQREAIVGRIENVAVVVEQRDRLAVLALGNLDQGKLQDDLWLATIDGQRVREGRFSRVETARGEISVAEKRAETGIVRGLGDRPLGKVDGHRHVVRIQRRHRLGGEADVHIRLSAKMGGRGDMGLRRGAARDHRSKRSERNG